MEVENGAQNVEKIETQSAQRRVKLEIKVDDVIRAKKRGVPRDCFLLYVFADFRPTLHEVRVT